MLFCCVADVVDKQKQVSSNITRNANNEHNSPSSKCLCYTVFSRALSKRRWMIRCRCVFFILSAFSIDMIFILPEILPIFVTLAPFVFWEVRPRNGTNLGIRMLFACNFKLQAINENKHPISTSHKIQCFLINRVYFASLDRSFNPRLEKWTWKMSKKQKIRKIKHC